MKNAGKMVGRAAGKPDSGASPIVPPELVRSHMDS